MSVLTEKIRMIKVSEKTYEALTDMGRKNESYDEIVWKLIQNYRKANKFG